MNFISKKTKLKYYTKEIFKVTNIMAIALIIIIAILLIKYKAVYQVSISGIKVGYVNNKKEFEQIVNTILSEKKTENVAFVDIEEKPSYEWKFVDSQETVNEETVLAAVEKQVKTTYTMYAVTVKGDEKTYVKNIEEAQQVVEQLKEETKQEDLDIGVRQIYTEKEKPLETIEVATTNLKEEISKDPSEDSDEVKESPEKATTRITIVNGISLANKPITGTITSRFGVNSRIRSSSHTGLDISAKTGTPIKACASGTVVFSGTKGSYGKLVRISHGNGVETWYGHCSKLYVSEGDTISAGDIIASVGSTGNSTGSHLHLEIRIHDKPVNPQNYLYK